MRVVQLALIIVIAGLAAVTAGRVHADNHGLPLLPDEVAEQFPAIGRLWRDGFEDRQGCTATLVAPDLIVTAAHCASRRGRSSKIFAAGWSNGEHVALRGMMLELRHPAYAVNNIHSPSNDVALIVLDEPILDVTPIRLWQGDASDLYGTDVALIGYHRARPDGLTGSFACPVSRFAEGLLRVDCRVVNGNSVGPILNQTDADTWQVVGIVSSQIQASAVVVELPDWLHREVAAHLQQ